MLFVTTTDRNGMRLISTEGRRMRQAGTKFESGDPASGRICLEQASAEVGISISRKKGKQEFVRKDFANGNRIEIRRLYLFDDRGLELALFDSKDRRPFMTAQAFTGHRFRYVLDWFTYLGNRPETMRSEIRLNQAVEEFADRSDHRHHRRQTPPRRRTLWPWSTTKDTGARHEDHQQEHLTRNLNDGG